jgi:hypothetical protein
MVLTFRRLGLAAFLTPFMATACNAVLGLGEYSVESPDSSLADAPSGTDSGRPDDAAGEAAAVEASCDAWTPASGQCYACPPATNPQILNACTNADCVPFDDKARVTKLLSDGGLPPVPDPFDGGPG